MLSSISAWAIESAAITAVVSLKFTFQIELGRCHVRHVDTAIYRERILVHARYGEVVECDHVVDNRDVDIGECVFRSGHGHYHSR